MPGIKGGRSIVRSTLYVPRAPPMRGSTLGSACMIEKEWLSVTSTAINTGRVIRSETITQAHQRRSFGWHPSTRTSIDSNRTGGRSMPGDRVHELERVADCDK